jgi:hypothetical protein
MTISGGMINGLDFLAMPRPSCKWRRDGMLQLLFGHTEIFSDRCFDQRFGRASPVWLLVERLIASPKSSRRKAKPVGCGAIMPGAISDLKFKTRPATDNHLFKWVDCIFA